MGKTVGRWAEDVAREFLVRKGFTIVARNVSYPFGEIDVVAKDDDILVFVEVKYRKSEIFGAPFEAVTSAKQKKIIRAALAFLQNYQREPFCRFDVISVTGDLAAPSIEHICDAFCLEDIC